MLRKWTVKELIFRIYKEVLKFNIYTKNPLIKKEKYLNAYLHISPTNIYIYSNVYFKYMKGGSIVFWATREMQIKVIMRYHCTPTKLLKFKRLTVSNSGKDAEQ